MQGDGESWLAIDIEPDVVVDEDGDAVRVSVMRVFGDVDRITQPVWEAGLDRVCAQRSRRIVVDCIGMGFCGAAGLAALMQTVARHDERGGDVATVGLPARLTGLCASLLPGPQPRPYPSVTAAITAVGPASVTAHVGGS